MARKKEFSIDIGDSNSAVLTSDGSLIIMHRQIGSAIDDASWLTTVVISPVGVLNLKALLDRVVELKMKRSGKGRERLPILSVPKIRNEGTR